MPTKTNAVEYQTVVVGAAYLVKGILRRVGFVSAIDDVLQHQPEVETTYGTLAQVMVTNRSFDKAKEIAKKIDGEARPFEELEALLSLADVVISSTGSPTPIVDHSLMKPVMRARRYRSLFL